MSNIEISLPKNRNASTKTISKIIDEKTKEYIPPEGDCATIHFSDLNHKYYIEINYYSNGNNDCVISNKKDSDWKFKYTDEKSKEHSQLEACIEIDGIEYTYDLLSNKGNRDSYNNKIELTEEMLKKLIDCKKLYKQFYKDYKIDFSSLVNNIDFESFYKYSKDRF